jgi:hypothetical protein
MRWSGGRHSYRGTAGNSRAQRLRSKLPKAITLGRLQELLAPREIREREMAISPQPSSSSVQRGGGREGKPSERERRTPRRVSGARAFSCGALLNPAVSIPRPRS